MHKSVTKVNKGVEEGSVPGLFVVRKGCLPREMQGDVAFLCSGACLGQGPVEITPGGPVQPDFCLTSMTNILISKII